MSQWGGGGGGWIDAIKKAEKERFERRDDLF